MLPSVPWSALVLCEYIGVRAGMNLGPGLDIKYPTHTVLVSTSIRLNQFTSSMFTKNTTSEAQIRVPQTNPVLRVLIFLLLTGAVGYVGVWRKNGG
jgi:hypothetical protein